MPKPSPIPDEVSKPLGDTCNKRRLTNIRRNATHILAGIPKFSDFRQKGRRPGRRHPQCRADVAFRPRLQGTAFARVDAVRGQVAGPQWSREFCQYGEGIRAITRAIERSGEGQARAVQFDAQSAPVRASSGVPRASQSSSTHNSPKVSTA